MPRRLVRAEKIRIYQLYKSGFSFSEIMEQMGFPLAQIKKAVAQGEALEAQRRRGTR